MMLVNFRKPFRVLDFHLTDTADRRQRGCSFSSWKSLAVNSTNETSFCERAIQLNIQPKSHQLKVMRVGKPTFRVCVVPSLCVNNRH